MPAPISSRLLNIRSRDERTYAVIFPLGMGWWCAPWIRPACAGEMSATGSHKLEIPDELKVNAPQVAYLHFLGSPFVTGRDGTRLTGPSVQRHRIALLALLAANASRGLTRERLFAYLWPDRDTEHVRQLLNQAVYNLRKALGDDAILSAGDALILNADVVRSDFQQLDDAFGREDHRAVVQLYQGPFLDGFFLPDSNEFDVWKETERVRIQSLYGRSLEALARAAAEARDSSAAVEWWRKRAALDPFDSRVAVCLMEAFEASGNRAGALQHASVHQRLLAEDVGATPPPELVRLAEQLRQAAETDTERTTRDVPSVTPSQPQLLAPARLTRRFPVARTLGYTLATASLALSAIMAVSSRSTGSVPVTQKRALGRPPRNVAAYELYKRASDPVHLRSETGARTALGLFQQAIALDSTYAAAWAGLARMHGRVSGSLPAPDRARHLALGREAAMRAVALDDSLAEAHGTLGIAMMMAFDMPAAERHLKRAIELDPAAGAPHEWIVTTYLWMRRPGDAIAHAEEALRLDPLSPSAHAEVARALAQDGRVDDALQHLDAIADLDPPLLRAAAIRAHCYAMKGMWEEAITLLRSHAQHRMWGMLGYLLARTGQREEAVQILSDLSARAPSEGSNLFDEALITAGLGELDTAVYLIDKAIEERSMIGGPGPADVFIMGPLFDDLRRRPGFARVRARLGLPPNE